MVKWNAPMRLFGVGGTNTVGAVSYFRSRHAGVCYLLAKFPVKHGQLPISCPFWGGDVVPLYPKYHNSRGYGSQTGIRNTRGSWSRKTRLCQGFPVSVLWALQGGWPENIHFFFVTQFVAPSLYLLVCYRICVSVNLADYTFYGFNGNYDHAARKTDITVTSDITRLLLQPFFRLHIRALP